MAGEGALSHDWNLDYQTPYIRHMYVVLIAEFFRNYRESLASNFLSIERECHMHGSPYLLA